MHQSLKLDGQVDYYERVQSVSLVDSEDDPLAQPSVAGQALASAPAQNFGPDNPPWGIPTALGIWLASIGLLIVTNVLFLIPYILILKLRGAGTANLTSNRWAVLLLVLSVIPAHLLTLCIAWLVIVRGRQHSVITSLGLYATPFWLSLAFPLGIVLFAVSIPIVKLSGETETDLDRILASSKPTAIVLALIAAFSAPLVEEVVYRGFLYSALQRRVSKWGAVALVAIAFLAIHVPQYWPNKGVILAIGILSISLTVVRAQSGSLLPSILIHFVFNSIQSLLIVAGVLLGKPEAQPLKTAPEQVQALVQSLAHIAARIF